MGISVNSATYASLSLRADQLRPRGTGICCPQLNFQQRSQLEQNSKFLIVAVATGIINPSKDRVQVLPENTQTPFNNSSSVWWHKCPGLNLNAKSRLTLASRGRRHDQMQRLWAGRPLYYRRKNWEASRTFRNLTFRGDPVVFHVRRHNFKDWIILCVRVSQIAVLGPVPHQGGRK